MGNPDVDDQSLGRFHELTIYHGQGLYGLAPGVPFCLYNLPDGIEAYLYMVLFREYRLNLRGCQPEQLRAGILWKTCNVELYKLTKDVDVLGMLRERSLSASSLFTDSALFEVVIGLKLMTTSLDGITGNGEDTTDKVYTMPAFPFCYDGDELSRLSLVCISEVLHFLVCY